MYPETLQQDVVEDWDDEDVISDHLDVVRSGICGLNDVVERKDVDLDCRFSAVPSPLWTKAHHTACRSNTTLNPWSPSPL